MAVRTPLRARRLAARAFPRRTAGSAVGGARTGVLAGLAEQGLLTVTTLVLVRILSPAEFGVVAAATVVIGLISLVTSLGFTSLIVAVPDLPRRTIDTLFWAVAGLGILIAVVGVVMSGVLAGAVGTPEAAPYLAGLCPALAARTLSAMPRAMLQRDRLFSAVYGNQVRNAVVYATVAIAVGAAGGGAWSIVVGQGVSAALSLVSLMLLARYWPGRQLDVHELVRLRTAAFASLSLVAATYFCRNADYWVIGHSAGPAVLGVYYVAYVLPSIIRVRVSTSVPEILLTVFTRLKDQPDLLRDRYVRATGAVALVGVPTLLGLGAVADAAVGTLFGPQWSDAALPLALLSTAALVELLMQVANPVYWVYLDFRSVARLQGIRVLAFSAALVAVPLGDDPLLWAAVANIVSVSLAAAASVASLRSRIDLRPVTLLHTVRGPLVAGAAMFMVVRQVDGVLAGPAPVVLVAQVVTGALVYGVGVVALRRWTASSGALLAEALPTGIRARVLRLLAVTPT